MLVKGHSESDLRVDPTNPDHLIGASKWVVSAEGYNHLLGFYESFDGGRSWPVQGHIPGYEGWTDNTDPVGAFDSYGNYYALLLPYQFVYKADGSHDFTVGSSQEANPAVPSEAISVAVRPHGATTATQRLTTRAGHPDHVTTYGSIGNSPDKQWITIDTNPASAHFNRVFTTAPDGTVSLAFYDRRLPCPAAGTPEAVAAGLALDTANPSATGPLPPYGAANYCVNTSVQFYNPVLTPYGHNIRLSAHTFDPQLDSPHEGSSTFIGDYFGNAVAPTASGAVDHTTSVTTYDDGTNPGHLQQQLVSAIAVP